MEVDNVWTAGRVATLIVIGLTVASVVLVFWAMVLEALGGLAEPDEVVQRGWEPGEPGEPELSHRGWEPGELLAIEARPERARELVDRWGLTPEQAAEVAGVPVSEIAPPAELLLPGGAQ
jgi:hypothetical protein